MNAMSSPPVSAANDPVTDIPPLVPAGTAFADPENPEAIDVFYFPDINGDGPVLSAGNFAAAFNDAVRKAEATSQEKMAGLTAGLPLPPGFKLPF